MNTTKPHFSEAYLAESLAPQLTIVNWVTTMAAVLVLGLKLFTTGVLKKTIGLDDLFISLATVGRFPPRSTELVWELTRTSLVPRS